MDKIYTNKVSLFRSQFATRAGYLRAYRGAGKRYGFKVRVMGGWKFFERADDYRTWKNQK